MNILNSIWNLIIRIRDIGVPEDMPPEEAKHVKLMNSMLLVSVLILCPFFLLETLRRGWMINMISIDLHE